MRPSWWLCFFRDAGFPVLLPAGLHEHPEPGRRPRYVVQDDGRLRQDAPRLPGQDPVRTGSGAREDCCRPVQHEAVQGSLSGRPVCRRNPRTGYPGCEEAPRRKWPAGYRRDHLHHGLPPDEGWQQGYRIPQGQPPHRRAEEGPERCSGSGHQEHEGRRRKHLPHCPWQPELGRAGQHAQVICFCARIARISSKTRAGYRQIKRSSANAGLLFFKERLNLPFSTLQE